MKLLTTILACLLGAYTFAQTVHDSSNFIYAWHLLNNFSTQSRTPIDTILTNFQNYNPINKNFISSSTLGNLGSPVISNVFTDRPNGNNVFFLNQYLPFLNTAENTDYYNTKTPFSYIFYTTGGSSETREETFEVFFTQNIVSNWNFGLKYDMINAKGQYRYLNVKKNSFRIFTSYTGNKYVAHASFNLNRLKNDENGGIIDSVFRLNNYTRSLKEIPSEFVGSDAPTYTSNARNRVRYYDVMISQRLKLFTIGAKQDSLKKDSLKSFAEPILTYVFKIDRTSKAYAHDPNQPNYYDSVRYNPYNTYDSVTNFKMLNTLQLEFKTVLKGKVQAGIYGLLGNYYENYGLYSKGPDSLHISFDSTLYNPSKDKTFNTHENQENTYVEAGIYGNFWRKVSTRFSGMLYFAGQKAGQYMLQGQLDSRLSILKKEFDFGANAKLENKYPDYLLNNYYSNNYMWSQNLKKENWVHLSSKIAAPSNNFDLSFNYYLIRNYIYFDTIAKPENYTPVLNYISFEIDKTFRLWKICSSNQLVYQKVLQKDQNILYLPDFVIHNSTYLDYNIRFKKTNGELGTMLGVDIYYNTSFKGYKYSPALAQFYNQDQVTIGDYPRIDAFLNIQIKAVRCFFIYQHFNSDWLGQNYYSAVQYPYNKHSFKIGISWTFYN